MERKRQMGDNAPLEPPPKRRTSIPLGRNRIIALDPSSAAASRMCEVCGEDESTNSFPNATQVSFHDHEHDVCHECFAMHLDVEVDSKMWDQVSCPQCPSLLQQHEIQNLATPECFAKYARFARRAALSSNPDYRYCFSTSCESGQVYEGSEPVFSCQECGHRHCTVCEVDWHKDETCEQYQARNQIQKGYEAESEATLQATSKPCPNCQARIEKSDGCDHMLCSQCQHQFCWACLADFIPIARHGLHNHHPDCPNHRPAGDNNEDMIAHAGAMLLMANGRFQEMLEEVFGFRLQ
ncbi:hypothetical protein D6D02_07434 [Aureobasidium pullulans]|nr:hypothetical protein D6D03_09112 [Aureobasidium pullulans]THY06629.1 hypothetical protein D6D02_07434 [Aureobasidium pullulans]THZ19262.1 hypothetical protein D6C89_07848 [Aureobasidium pullulans]